MKKIFIWLLIVAAGAAIAYACIPGNTSDRVSESLLIGKWQMDSLNISKTKDSLNTGLLFLAQVEIGQDARFVFHSNGILTSDDPTAHDSGRYEMKGKNELLISEKDT